ncbi:MAG: hypothetical protein JWO25_2869 [Alphaproteobacteria bacterium]|nr:hypothetical protein [Alphaproteobacteria bacterium]
MCSFKGHCPSDRIFHNRGYSFARCARCGTGLVEIKGAWRTPPKGMRIVWPAEMGRGGDIPSAPAGDQREAGGDRRAGADRRTRRGPLPAFLRGRDRRGGGRDRRTAFGRRFRGN